MNPHTFLDSLAPSTMKLGLDRMLACDAALGHPWRTYRSLHVAGTNGKGSTSAFAEAIFRAAGKKVGLYTSPHLEAVNERIRVDGLDASDAELAAGIEAIVRAYPPAGEPTHEEALTYFEFLTALALWLFRERGCEVAVVEVGLGGRLDATNVLTPAAWVIATIGLDHTEYLGNTIGAIAREKAGIIKPGVPGAILTTDPEALAAIREVAASQGVSGLEFPRDFGLDRAPGGQVRLPGRAISGVSLALAGAHQLGNASLAAAGATLTSRDLSDDAIRAGLATARWPGRLERVGDVLLDGAHNADGAAALAYELERMDGPIHLLFGVLGDKDAARILQLLVPKVAGLHVVAPSNPRALAPEKVLALLPVGTQARAHGSVPQAIAEARAAVAQTGRGQVVVAGSLYLVGEARRWLLRGGGS
jgi:dihydrofolate synthase/folylpolyglutamate synthase